jgi:DNA-binding FadR family transcriptional regulator
MPRLAKTAPSFGSTPVTFVHERVEIPKAAQIVASRIRRRIIDGDLKPGGRLAPEAELAADFQVSRPVVREALRVLEAEHFIKLGRGARHGATIGRPASGIVARAAGISLRMEGATLGDIFEARALIEPSAARFAAARRPKEAAAALSRRVDHQLRVIGDRPEFVRAQGAFHRTLLEECGNISMAVTGHSLQRVVETHLDIIREREPEITETNKDDLWTVRSYQRLVDLIAASDSAGAEAHWLIHINAIAKCWLGWESVVEIPD